MTNGNEPASPKIVYTRDIVDTQTLNNQPSGLTKREHFAGLAMQGMVCNPALMEAVTASQLIEGDAAERVAEMAARYADALITELNKQKV